MRPLQSRRGPGCHSVKLIEIEHSGGLMRCSLSVGWRDCHSTDGKRVPKRSLGDGSSGMTQALEVDVFWCESEEVGHREVHAWPARAAERRVLTA
jgi:hypothetical protein